MQAAADFVDLSLCRILYKQHVQTGYLSVIVNPNDSSRYSSTAILDTVFSESGKLLAYSLSENGSDWVKIKVCNAENGRKYPDQLNETKFPSITWTHDDKGFFYAVNILAFGIFQCFKLVKILHSIQNGFHRDIQG